MATQSSSRTRYGSRGKTSGGKNASRARSATSLDSAHLEGREPSHDPDVYVDVRKPKVNEV
jgi:hypothetical protein